MTGGARDLLAGLKIDGLETDARRRVREGGGPRVLVIGGGLAGLAAAVRLVDRGVPVTLVETRKRLGGRATSFIDPATGDLLDNCQHVLMRCCTHLLALYRRLGVERHIEWHRRFHLWDGEHLDTLEGDGLPAPLHMTRSLMSFRSLTWGEKLQVSRGMAAVMQVGAEGRGGWHGKSFGAFLREHGQSERVIARFWSPIVVSALNEQIDRMAADYAMQVFQDGFLSTGDGYEMGLSRVPLVQLYDAAETAIRQGGGRVLLGTSAERLLVDGGRVVGLALSDGSSLEAEMVVSALPFDRLAKLCDGPAVGMDERLAGLGKFEVSPIIGIHLWFDQPVMDLPHVALTRSPLHWLFNKGIAKKTVSDTVSAGLQKTVSDTVSGGGQHLHGVISAAYDMVDKPAEEIVAMALREAAGLLPVIGSAWGPRLVHSRVVKEKRATFALRPGVDRLRPGPRGAIANLYTAGDWCDSGWPATMEGAVRTGNHAAAALLADRGMKAPVLPGELKASTLYGWVAGR